MEKRLKIIKKANGEFSIKGFVGYQKVFQLDYDIIVFDRGEWHQSSFSVPQNVEEFTDLGSLIVSARSYMKLIEADLFREDKKTVIVNEPVLIDIA